MKNTSPAKRKFSQKALPLFFFGILISTFVGGAVRAFFSPRQIEMWVSKTLERENPQINISFSHGSLSLSNKAFPRLGLVFEKVHIQPKDLCKINADLFVDQLYLPIEVFDFFRGKLKFRQIEIGRAELNLAEKKCPEVVASKGGAEVQAEKLLPKTVSPEVEPVLTNPFKSEVAAALNFIHLRWAKEMRNTSERVRGLSISELKLRRGSRPIANLKNLNLNTSSDEEFHLDAVLELHRLQGLVDKFAPIYLEVSVDPEVLKFKLREQILEGQASIKGEVLLSSLHFNSVAEFSNIPSRPIFDLIVRNSWSENNLNWPRQSWGSGVVRVAGEIDQLKSARFQFENWKFEGDLGSAVLKSFSVKPFTEEPWAQALRIEFHELKMDPAFEMLGFQRLKGLFESFGIFKGELVALSPTNLELIGSWEELKLKFSNKNIIQAQEFAFETKLSRMDERWSGQVSKVDLKGGSFKGELSFNFSEDNWSGPFQIKIEQLLFSPAVQKLMLSGIGEAIELYGSGDLDSGKIQKWEGSLGWPRIESAGWSAQGLKIHSKLSKDQGLALKVDLKDLKLDPSHSLFAEFKPLYLDQKLAEKNLHWHHLRTRLKLKEGSIFWSKAMAKDISKKILFSSEGEWNTNKELKGWISVDFPVLKLLKWEVSGSLREPRIRPSAKMLKDLARKNPGFNIATFLPPQKAKQERSFESISEKVIESAKKILPTSKAKEPDQPL